MKYAPLKLKTKQEKAIAAKILDELVIFADLVDSFPKGRDKMKKRWTEGFIFGIKQSIMNIAEKMNDPKKKDFYEKMIDLEKEKERLFGKRRYKLLQKLEEKNKDKLDKK